MVNVEAAQTVLTGSLISVLVAYSPRPREVDLIRLSLPAGTTLREALLSSGMLERHGLSLDVDLVAGVWMKVRPLDTVLREADRVEIWRPLKVDPKEARRQRYRKQKSEPSGRAASV